MEVLEQPVLPQDTVSSTNWRNGKSHGERMIHFLKNAYSSDVKFFVGPQKIEIKAHKAILSIHSVVFSDLFDQDKQEVNFLVGDSTPEEFQLFLEYVYSGHEVKDVRHAYPLLQLSIKYKISELELHSTQLLMQAITDKTVVPILEQSSKYGDASLQAAAFEYILRRGFRILDSPSFLELSKPNLIQILGRDDLLAVSEEQVFNAFIRWGKAEMSRQKMPDTQKYLRSVLEGMIPLIRFPVMNKSDFSLKVAPLQLLTVEEVMATLLYFNVDEDVRGEMPPGVFNTTPRLPYVPMTEGKEYIAVRLKPSPSVQSSDLSKNVSTGCHYILANQSKHSIRFKASHPIWITSIGMLPQCGNHGIQHYQAKYEIHDLQRRTCLASYNHHTGKLLDLTSVTQVSIEKQVLILPRKWYSASIQITSGSLLGSVYTSDVDSVIVETEAGMGVTFHFANEEPMPSPCYTGVTQGYIPTLGFRIE